jgi:hypothetical protein
MGDPIYMYNLFSSEEITSVNSLGLLIREFSLQVKTTYLISLLRIIIYYTTGMFYVYNYVLYVVTQ